MSDRPATPEEVRRRLAKLGMVPASDWSDRGAAVEGELSPAAVLIPIFERDGRLHVVFTRRAADLNKHSGEVSFPGGRAEPIDASKLETALRETHEEIALSPEDVEVYGALAEMPTITGYNLEAWTGEFPHPYELRPEPSEIEVIFDVPLDVLADPAIHRVEMRSWGDQTFPVHYYEYDGYTIWGVTGYLVWVLLDYLGLRD
jgi:8-oxo-dGTP pyrophosphatase MutT (NUDIX family)